MNQLLAENLDYKDNNNNHLHKHRQFFLSECIRIFPNILHLSRNFFQMLSPNSIDFQHCLTKFYEIYSVNFWEMSPEILLGIESEIFSDIFRGSELIYK